MVASKIRVFAGARPTLEQSGALPSGGSLDVSMQQESKTVDKCVSHVDRNRLRLTRKPVEASKIFIPLNPNDVPRDPKRGQALHTDPFAECRPHVEFRKSKVKIATPRAVERPANRRVIKGVPVPDRTVKPHDFIGINGVRHTSPKRVPKEKHATTIDLEQPQKNFDGNRRFAKSPERLRNAASLQQYSAPRALTAAPQTLQLGASSAPSYRPISNAFFDLTIAPSQQPPLALSGSSDNNAKHSSVRVNQKALAAISMEGVFSPMRNGKVPRPQPTLAPWAQQTVTPHSGRSIRGRPVTGPAPFAITE